MKTTYKSSGVDIAAGEKTVDNIKSLTRATFSKNVLQGIGHFGAFYKLDLKQWKNPVLVSSVDGVGTKLKIAIALNKHDTVGQDLVNHCVNDIAVCGAVPQYFMDYIAFGKLVPEKATKIVKGFSIACKENNVSLIGGETAEMPGFYALDEYDLAGMIVGIVEKNKIINGNKTRKGDLLIGFKSTGLHTNGYSLARKVLLEKYSLNEKPSPLKLTIGEELLKVHRSYLKLIRKLVDNIKIKAFSHITGGGIMGNTKRVVPKNLKINIDWNSWEIPPIFQLIQQTGKISNIEMRKTFNLGIGLVAVINKKDLNLLIRLSKQLGEEAIIIGEIY
ncbi:MAG: phosphoribosylformylglycinamidine cyclo-ligase [Ignavibacteriales bacterium]|nr:phosphoribosylformylglycinamidine cyclo-ligase [Ignavibacteriales bacterium]